VPSGSPAGYNICWNDNSWSPLYCLWQNPNPLASGSTQTYNLTGMNPGTVVYVGIQTISATGQASPWSNIAKGRSNEKVFFATYAQLSSQYPGCTVSTAQSGACLVAASRYCKNVLGYVDGYGATEFSSTNTQIHCVGWDMAAVQLVNWTTLKSYQSLCTGYTLATNVVCSSAVNRYCAAKGYATGLNINELSTTQGEFSCIKKTAAEKVINTVTWPQLAVGACTFANMGTPEVCMTASSRYCQARGYAGGFGVQEYTSTAAQVTCLKGP
jgi:hypothetical protein